MLLWSQLVGESFADAENLIRAGGHHLQELEPYPPGRPWQRKDAVTAIAELRRWLGNPAQFDLFALRCLKGLDRILKDRGENLVNPWPLPGVDGREYLVRRRNAFLARHFEQLQGRITWIADQGHCLATYATYHLALPVAPVGDFRIVCRGSDEWGNRLLHERLFELRSRLRIMIWPLSRIDYSCRHDLAAPNPPSFVSLDRVDNEAELTEEVERAIAEAGRTESTLLILPELAIPPAVEERMRKTMTTSARDAHPLLVVFGRCHRRNHRGDLDLNEAVLLGSRGEELLVHRKLTSLSSHTEAGYVGEQVETGDTVTVYESAIGNLALLICLDSFNQSVQEVLWKTHANLLLVPSLSPKTSAHMKAAEQRQVHLLASSFVCNRRFTEQQPTAADPVGTSFFHLPRTQNPRRLRLHVQPVGEEETDFRAGYLQVRA